MMIVLSMGGKGLDRPHLSAPLSEYLAPLFDTTASPRTTVLAFPVMLIAQLEN